VAQNLRRDLRPGRRANRRLSIIVPELACRRRGVRHGQNKVQRKPTSPTDERPELPTYTLFIRSPASIEKNNRKIRIRRPSAALRP
jgi:hypothetical protein